MSCIQLLSHVFDWTTLSNSTIENRDHQAPVLLLWNSAYYKTVAVKIGPVNAMQLYVNNYTVGQKKRVQNGDADNGNEDGDENETDLAKVAKISNIDWVRVENDFMRVDINSYPGRSLIKKFELFLADIAVI